MEIKVVLIALHKPRFKMLKVPERSMFEREHETKKITKTSDEHPDLSYEIIKDILEAQQETHKKN